MATGTLSCTAARMAMFWAKAVLPMEGRAATMIMSEGWSLAVI